MDIIYSKVINEIGEYPFSEIYKKVADLKEKGIKVIDFGVGDPKSPTPDFIIDNLSKFARNRATSGYPSYIGDIATLRPLEGSCDRVRRIVIVYAGIVIEERGRF